ncbi:diguanylate cyclase domain-containing protein [Halalkalibacter sp. AB-rgal2]|uniref:sensor domain-containing diguanylate cyclase n=1 Tax=Halalkalibacter sp. AB-rgal2 TaxID=3242695 RepID=UPI00359D4CC1
MKKVANVIVDNNLLKKYEQRLKGIATVYQEQTEVGWPALFFLTEKNLTFLLLEKAGDMSETELRFARSLVEANPHQRLYECNDYFQKNMVKLPNRLTANSSDDLYLGMVTPLNSSNGLDLNSFIKGLAMLFYYQEPKKLFTPFSVMDLLNDSAFDIELHSLVDTFSSYYERTCNRSILVYERQDDHLYALTSNVTIPSIIELSEFGTAIQQTNHESCCFIHGEALFASSDKSYIMYPVYLNGELILVFFFPFVVENTNMSLDDYKHWFEPFIPLLQKSYVYERKKHKSKRREILLQVMKKFHSTMKSEDVLHEIVEAIHEAFPGYFVYLLLSQEWKGKDGIPIKPLLYGNEVGSKVVEHAYVTGEIQIVKRKDKLTLFVPLRGKQGVYGVMEIKAPHTYQLPKGEVEFIQMLADTGGNALENAELYQQSRHLIQDLQLINETTHQLNEHRRLTDTVHYMTSQIIESFGAEEVGFILFQEDNEVRMLEGSTGLFHERLTSAQLSPLFAKMKVEKEPIYIGELEVYDIGRIPRFQSLLAVPMIHNQKLTGMVIALHHEPYHFTFGHFKLFQSMIRHSTLAMTNSMLHEELERLVITDHLTELYSRNYLDEQVQSSMEKDREGTFLLIDIDDFKHINDTYGHQVGDQVIIQVANVLKEMTTDRGIAARWGGEELALYLPEITLEDGRQLAKKMLVRIKQESNPSVTVSIGISYWGEFGDSSNLNQLFQRADQSLYEAKETGKNKFVTDE